MSRYKMLLLFFIGLTFCLSSNAQIIPHSPNKINSKGEKEGKWTILIDNDRNVVLKPGEASYYRLIIYKDGRPQGKVLEYTITGKKVWEGYLIADDPEDVFDGINIWYYNNGLKEKEVSYKDGAKNGQSTSYYDNGNKKAEGSYDYDVENEDWIFYNSDGSQREPGWEWLHRKVEAYAFQGNYVKATETAKQAIIDVKKEYGKENEYYILALDVLAISYQRQGQYNKAEPLLQESLTLNKTLFGPSSREYANALYNLAILYQHQINYVKAEPLLLEATTLLNTALGESHMESVTCLQSLALLYEQQGIYGKAEPVYLRLINIIKNSLTKSGLEKSEEQLALKWYYCGALDALANLYEHQGNYIKAESLLLESIAVQKDTLAEPDLAYANTLGSLALLYKLRGGQANAEPLLNESISIYEKALSDSTYEKSGLFHNLASLYMHIGNYPKAESLWVESLKYKTLGETNSNYAIQSEALAKLYEQQGEYSKSKALHQQTLAIRKNTLGDTHIDYALSLIKLAVINSYQQNFLEAEPLFLEANKIILSHINNNFPYYSEHEKELFINKYSRNLSLFIPFAFSRSRENPALVAEVYNNQLASKSLLLQSTRRVRQHIKESGDTILLNTYEQWVLQRETLARLYNLSKAEIAQQSIKLDSLEAVSNRLEKELSIGSQAFANATDRTQYKWQDIQKVLKKGEAAIEIIRYNKYAAQGGSVLKDSTQYAAIIVTRKSKYPKLVILENGNYLEGLLLKSYRSDIRNQRNDSESYMYFFSPIKKALEGIKRIYFSPDGVYNQISLASLYNKKNGKYLFEELDLINVTSTKDLLFNKSNNLKDNEAVLIGYPDYDLSKDKQQLRAQGLTASKQIQFYGKPNLTRSKISELPATKLEVENISKLLTAEGFSSLLLLKEQALEEAIKAIKSPKLLHIATHGYFQPYADTEKASQNPLLRSGLLLAGAGRTMSDTLAYDPSAKNQVEDGILTAYEAMNLELEGCDLVVLSACETGLGEVRNGEGVYGLQRAFKVAGAENILMSLWKVDDKTTQELMSNFYTAWLKGNSKTEAFRKAQRQIKEKYKDPYFWAAFVLVGH